jgi:ankyrin repeat protein
MSGAAQEATERLRRTFVDKRKAFAENRQASEERIRKIVEMQQHESELRQEVEPRDAEQHQYPDPSFSMSLSSSMKKSGSSDPSTGEETVSSENDGQYSEVNPHLALHDLCSEATSPDDVAWRNALYLLSLEPELATVKADGWSPLHICCLGSAPPPDFMVRAILYCEPSCARAIDDGGRLPLHMIAASSADPAIMQLLVEEYPQAVYKTDGHGMTPLHMLMRNDEVELTMDRVRILLGQTGSRDKRPARRERIVQRRGQHLELNVEEINNRMVNREPPGDGELDISFDSLDEEQRHDLEKMMNYPDDVKVSFQKMAMWKRKQKRINKDKEDIPVSIDLAQSLEHEEKNPAAIAVPRSKQLALHMAVRRKDRDDDPFKNEDDYYFDVRNPPPNRNEIMRVLIAAYPRGLVTRDANGHTPLMLVLLNQDCLPNLELIQLLLGTTTSGFQSPPPWADDLPLHESPEAKYSNPAMVPTTDTNQLPLHVAAEEMPSFCNAIESIHDAYPGAVVVQDVRGRTPLHMALRNYQRIQPDPKVVSLLLTDKVAQIRDDDGFLPFDLLVGGAHNLPKEEPTPSLWEDSTFDPSSVYKKFFIYVVMQAPRPRNRTEALAFLQRLRMLPPWLRRQACSVGFIQDMLVFEMASPEKCAFIIFNLVIWAMLLLMFRLQMDEYTNTGSAQSYYAPVINLLSSLILIGQFINWCISASLSVFMSQCLFNIWPWIDIVSASVTIAATSLIQGGSTDTNHIASVGTAATGLLWASVIGYFARWWYGMAVFMGRTLRVRFDSSGVLCGLIDAYSYLI